MIINKQSHGLDIDRDQDHLILIDKPKAWTSFDIVKKVRNLGSFKKVGHAGTLDPFATGLLILGTGRQTKKLHQISGYQKAYYATMKFGEETDTGDITGERISKTEGLIPDINTLKNCTTGFLGRSLQTPPMFSAKKVNGKRLYKLARKGITIQRKAHPIEIKRFEMTAFNELEADFYIECSKGTYIRTLASDLGKKTGYGAFLKALRRVSINGYHVEDALTIDEFSMLWHNQN